MRQLQYHNINVSMGIRHVGEMQILWIIVIWHV